ncbi:hypothetical protein Acsp04_14030 [Actinomadura sp. NBRC 104425]|uniref:hypothetical protein n=1 Tax=Actinomadura sp. NBRC 104425 TaxID=3032204 RepID=UPI0024A3B899|nr:hypothetical protein [Actinomadura sp. NBRC 104425]GLZ11168.1 hypothetical protein Acsp04_14030 [Actinomadura sp. NBRC 104425]
MTQGFAKLTRPDLPLPGRTGGASGTGNWHRFHHPIGVFATAYGATGLLTALISWDDRRAELADYIGSGLAAPALVLVKVVELLLVALTVAGLARRRDVWLLPALTGWAAGFALFAVVDVVKGHWVGLVEHTLYLAGFAFLLFLSYALSVRVRVGRGALPRPAERPVAGAGSDSGSPDSELRPSGLTRTQELALEALNRWQQRRARLMQQLQQPSQQQQEQQQPQEQQEQANEQKEQPSA